MKKIIYILVLVALYLTQPACSVFKRTDKAKNVHQDTLTTASGLKYVVLKKMNPKAPLAKSGEQVTVHYSGYFKDGKIFDSSVKRGQPIKFTLGKGQVIKGWDEGLQLMGTGDRFKFIVPYQLAYGERGRGTIPPKTDLIFDVEMIYHQPERKVEPYATEGLDTVTTASGLKMIKIHSTRLERPQKGQKVWVDYSGYLTDGSMFDSSVKRGEPISFKVGFGQVIKGWDEALLSMRKGEKARLIIPPNLGYGSRAAGLIPPNSTLIFDVHLVDIE